jgi:hypothetical protein
MSVAEEFKGLPIDELIGAPLIACAAAQGKLAMTTADFIKQVGMNGDQVRTVDFKYNTHDGSNVQENTVSVPLLSVVNVPNLAVKKANVDFTIEVKTQTVDKSNTSGTVNTEASYGGSWWCPVKAKISGSVTTGSEHTRSSDKSAKYNVSVEARDDGMPEGLARVLDILAQNIKNPSHAQ